MKNSQQEMSYLEVLEDYIGGYYQNLGQLTSANSTGPFEFNIAADGKHYVILPLTHLSGKIQIVDDTGAKLSADDAKKMGVVNLLPDSLFNHIDITVNNIKVSDSTANCYGYKAFIETQLSYGAEAKNTHLKAALYCDDTAGYYDSTLAANVGRAERTLPFAGSAKIEFETCVHADFFKIYRYLPNNCDVEPVGI
jgi:hypothetical protein